MKKPLWSALEIATATGGELRGDTNWQVNGISIDSRLTNSGDLFVALSVARDGHEFVADAIAAGAVASLVSLDAVPGAKVLVSDPQKALQSLAIAARERSAATHIAVTGSVGKTSVKDALCCVLAADAPTHSSIKSYNNQWGVPLSLARMPQDSRWAIFEIGTNHPGEIAPLSSLVRPQVGVITRIAEAHLAGFGSIEAIAREKASIWAALQPDGIAVLPQDGPANATLRNQASYFGVRNIWSFGSADTSDVQIVNWNTGPQGSTGRFNVRGTKVDVFAPVSGMHWAEVLAAVMAVAVACGQNPKDVAHKMRQVTATKGRGGWVKLALENGFATLIDDSYNANPTSMKAALDTLSRFPGTRKMAVIGQMLELGEDASRLHAELAWPVQKAGVERVWCVGALTQSLYQHLPKARRASVPKDIAGLAKSIYSDLRDGDVLLIKGSNGSGVHKVVTGLKHIAAQGEN